MSKRTTQNQMILEYLQNHDGISQAPAYRMGIARLAARISDLRKGGHDISTEMQRYKTDDGVWKTYALYRLER